MAKFGVRIHVSVFLALVGYIFMTVRGQDLSDGRELKQKTSKFQCESEGFFADSADCSIFYRCLDWGEQSDNSLQTRFTSFKFQCGSGFVFDSQRNSCIQPSITSRSECRYGGSEPLLFNFPRAESSMLRIGDANNRVDHGIGRPQDSYLAAYSLSYKPNVDSSLEPMSDVDNAIGEQPVRITRSSSCDVEGFFPIEGDCAHFYRCVANGKGFSKYEFSCGEGTVWDPDNNACNHAWAVQRKDCKNIAPENNNQSGAPDPNGEDQNPDEGQENGNENPDDSNGNKNPEPEPNTQSPGGYPNPTGAENPQTGQPDYGSNSPNAEGDGQISNNSVCSSEGFHPVQNDCKKFIRCVSNGRGYSKFEFECAEGTVWDADVETCNYPEAVRRSDCKSHQDGQPGTNENDSDADPGTTSNFPVSTNDGQTSTTSSEQNSSGTSSQQSSEMANQQTSSTSSQNSSSSHQTSSTSSHQTSSSSSSNQQTSSTASQSSSSANQGSTTNSMQQTSGTNQQSSSTSSGQQTSSTASGQQSGSTSSSGQQSSSTSSGQQTSSTASGQQSGSTSSTGQQSGSTSSTGQQSGSTTSSGQQSGSTSSTGQQSGSTSTTGQQSGSTSTTGQQSGSTSTTGQQSGSTSSSGQQTSTTSGQQSSSSNQQTSSTSSGNSNQTTTNQQSSTNQQGSTTQQTSTNSTSGQDKCTGEGFFPSSQSCNKFYRCVATGHDRYTKYDFDCGPGTVFDPDYNVCNHPWAVRNEKCRTGGQDNNGGSQSSTTPLSSSETTPIESTTNVVSGEPPSSTLGPGQTEPTTSPEPSQPSTNTSPSSSNGMSTTNHPIITTTTNEPGGTSNNTTTTPEPSSETNNTTNTPGQNTNKPSGKVKCTKAGFYPYPGDCKKFYRCVDWDGDKGERFSVYYFDCPEGTIFDPSLSTCNHEESVYPPRDCNNAGNSTTETTPCETSTPAEHVSTVGESTTMNTTEPFTEPTASSSEATTQSSTDLTTNPTHETTPSFTGSVTTEGGTTFPLTSSTGSTSTINPSESTTSTSNLITTTVTAPTDITTTMPSTLTPTNEKCPEVGPDQFAIVCPTGFRRHPKYCNLFYQCTMSPNHEIKVLTLSCTNGTVYDDEKIQCLPPDQARQCDGKMMDTRNLRQMTEDSTAPIPVKSDKTICPNEGSFAYKDDCRLFYKCKKDNEGQLKGFIYQCPEGFGYWNISKRCEKIQKVPCGSKKIVGHPSLAPIESKNVGHK